MISTAPHQGLLQIPASPPHRSRTAHHTTNCAQDVELRNNNASIRGGRTRTLVEGDALGVIAFFTGADQTEARLGRQAEWADVTGQCVWGMFDRQQQPRPRPRWACALPTSSADLCLLQTVSSLEVVRVLGIHRSDWESIAERFRDSARAVLSNLLSFAEEVGCFEAAAGPASRSEPPACCQRRQLPGLAPTP